MVARSIGSRAAVALRPGVTGRVLASFARVCDLVTDDGAVVALGCCGVERGPLTVLMDPDPAGSPWSGPPAGAAFRVSQRQVILEGHGWQPQRVDLAHAASWEARLEWESLTPRRRQILASAKIVARVATPAGMLDTAPRWEKPLERATAAVRAAYVRRDRDGLRVATGDLCGLGEGLTPQGDDWLAGWLLALRLTDSPHEENWDVEAIGEIVLDAAARRSTLLSLALLACAAAGESSESWHELLTCMARNPADEGEIHRSTRSVRAQGATSGAAMLQGFLAGLDPTGDSQMLQDRRGTDPR
jgi:hypothetical protein